MPSSRPPHRTAPLASGFHRFAMAALAVAGRDGWQVSDSELTHDEPSYTVTTLRRLHAEGYTSSELFFVIGADAFLEIRSWKDYPQILDAARFAVVSRPGLRASELPDRLGDLASRMTASFDSSDPSAAIDHFDRGRDRGRVIDCHPSAMRRGAAAARTGARIRRATH